MIEDVNERDEREICEFGRVLTEEERSHLAVQDEKAEASAAELRAKREEQSRERQKHFEEHGHYPTKASPCMYCEADKRKAAGGPQQLHGNAIECPYCKHVMLKTELADYRAHGSGCMAYEIFAGRVAATLAELGTRLLALENAHKRLEARLELLDAQKLAYDGEELRVSLLALARYILTPGECLAPDAPMYCGGSDLCPCRTDGHFAGTCGINETLVRILNEHIDKHPAPWRYHKANEKDPMHGETASPDPAHKREHCTSLSEYECGRCAACLANAAADPRVAYPDTGAAEPDFEPDTSPSAAPPGGPERAG